MARRARSIAPLTDAQRQLVEQNIALAYHEARRRAAFAVEPFDDLVQIACLGLCQAAQYYDPSLAKFSTFATRCIRNMFSYHFRRSLPGGYRTGDTDTNRKRRETMPGTASWPAGLDVEGFSDDRIDKSDSAEAFEHLIAELPDRDQEACRAVCVEGKTMAAVALDQGCCRERVRQRLMRCAQHAREVAACSA